MQKITLLLILFVTTLGYAQPTTSPASPTDAAVDVISVYGDTYSNMVNNYDPNWGQSGHMQVNASFDPGNGEALLAYPNFNYQGTELTAQDASTMEFLHIDIWTSATPGATDIQVSPINNGSGAGETLVSITYTSGAWTSVDIPKSAFSGMTWDSVFQMKFAANGPGSTVPVDIYLDNVYFWKAPTAPGSDATLSSLEIDGVALSTFASGIMDYTVELTPGTTVAPQITAATATDNSATSVTITQATGVPGSATVVVVSQNGMETETYTVSFITAGPTSAAPTPPNRLPADVISLFSNAYTNTTVETWNAAFDDSLSEDVVAFGDDLKKITFTNFIGVEFVNNRIDASAFTHFHMDFWTDNTDLIGKVFNSKFSQWGGTQSEVSAMELNINDGSTPAIVSGQWVSIDVPISSAFSNNLTRDDLAQFLITSNLGVVYVDNIYFHKNTTASNEDFLKNVFSAYPNPTTNSWNITSVDTVIESIQVYDLTGKLVLNQIGDSTNLEINAESLSQGIYVAKVSSISGVQNLKLVKE
jgi:hypothetical protein